MRLLGVLIAVVLLGAVATLVVDPFDDGDDMAATSASTTSTTATTREASTTSTSRATTSTSLRSSPTSAAVAATTTAAPTTTSTAPTTAAPADTTPTTTLVRPAPETPDGSDLPRGDSGPAAVTDDLAATGTGSAAGTALGLLVIVLGLIALEVARRLRA